MCHLCVDDCVEILSLLTVYVLDWSVGAFAPTPRRTRCSLDEENGEDPEEEEPLARRVSVSWFSLMPSPIGRCGGEPRRTPLFQRCA
jgi:hypothetical protein